MSRTRKVSLVTSFVLLVMAMLFGCSLQFKADSEQSDWYIKLVIDHPTASKAITVTEYDVTGLAIVVRDPDGEVIQTIDWKAEDGPTSYMIPVEQQGVHEIFVTHIGEHNSEIVEVTESTTFNIQAMVITVIDVIPGCIGLIRIGGMSPPTAVFTADSTSGSAPLAVSFDASGSSDPDTGDTLSFSWDFGDGSSGTGVASSHTYDLEGSYTVTLTVQDSIGCTDTADMTITVTSPDTVAGLIAWGSWYCDWCYVYTGNDLLEIEADHLFILALKSDGSLAGWGQWWRVREIPTENDFVAIAAGAHCLALKSDGSIVAWGYNNHGQCDVPSGNDYVAIDAGGRHSLALKSDGSLVAWGRNSEGQCDVPSGNDYVAIAAGEYHNLALRSDGSIVAWGSCYSGECDVPFSSDYVAIDAGYCFSLALKSDDSLVAWGWNEINYRQCDVPAGNDYVAISAGTFHSLALRSDGSLVAWGRDDYGDDWHWGEGVCDVPSGNNFVDIAAGVQISLALRK